LLGVLLLAVVVSLTAATTSRASQTTSQAAFRQQFIAYLAQMQHVGTTFAATPQGRVAFAQLRFNPATGISRAREAVRTMTPAQLTVLQRAMAAYPNWRAMPHALQKLVDRTGHARRPQAVVITPDDCPTARAAGYTQTDVEAAADASLAADAILEAVPSDVISIPVRIAAVIAWAIPQGIQRGFEHLYNIAQACDDADHQALLQTLSTDLATFSSNFNTFNSNFNALSTLVNNRLDVNISSRASQTSLDSLTSTFNSLNTLVNNRLDVTVSSRATQTSVTNFNNEFTANATVVNGKLDSITTSVTNANTKLDNLTITVNNQGALDLRLKIEEDLSNPSNHGIALFEIPASAGGYLNLVRDIVADTIAKMQATGQGVGPAQGFLNAGDSSLAAHDYKGAYANFGKAYRAAAG